MSDAAISPTYDQLRLSAELKARFKPADRSNAVLLPPEEHRQVMAELARDLGAFAKGGFSSAREMHMAAERAAWTHEARVDARPSQG